MFGQSKPLIPFLVFITLLLFLFGQADLDLAARHTVSSPANRSSGAIALNAGGSILLTVNPDSNSITLIDTITQQVIEEITVGLDPRSLAVDSSRELVYVANRGSNSISVLDLVSHEQVAEVPVGHHPYGVVLSPGGDWLYITEQGSDSVRCLDTSTLDTITQFMTGDRPTGLGISSDGYTLYVTHLLTNQISVIDINAQSIYLPLISRSGSDGGQQPSVGVDGGSPAAATNHSISTITLWPASNLVHSIVFSPDNQFAYIPHTRSNTSNQALTFDTTVFPLVSIIDLDTNEHLVGGQFDLGTLDPPGVGLPFDAAVAPDGGSLWVLNAASNDVTVVDLDTRQRLAHIEVSDNPRGIVLSNDGTKAYVNNTLAGSVSVIDTAAYLVTDVIPTTQIPLPPLLLNGKQLFHSSDDPRMSNAQWIACSTCHIEGEHDGRTWFFGFAGPRNTTSLLGMIKTYPLRWSGEWDESADSEFAIRKENFGGGLIDGEMNCSLLPADCVNHPPNQGRDYDLDALGAFIDSLQVPLSPNHTGGEPLDDRERNGQAIFTAVGTGCTECHPPPLYTDKGKHDVGTATIDERIGPVYDTPTLLGLYDSAPYFHDGSATSLYDALTFPSPGSEHDLSSLLSASEIQDLIAFLLALPYNE
jgi:YVTN family beta-propeller protein